MSRRGVDVLAVAAAVLCASTPTVDAFVQRRTATGAPFHWNDPGGLHYVVDRLGSRDILNDGGRQQVQWAFAWWSMDPHSTLRMTMAPGPPQEARIEQDGVNAVAWIEDPEFDGLTPDVLGSTRMYVDAETGEIYEADIWLNGAHHSWTSQWSSASVAASGPVYVQPVMTHLIGLFIGLDHSVNPEATMFPILAVGAFEGAFIEPEEESAVHTLYPSSNAPTATAISGRVFNPSGPVEGAYVSAQNLGTRASYGAITDASGRYAIRFLPAAQYRVRVAPYTTDPRITLSPYYRALPPHNLNSLAVSHAPVVTVAEGQVVNDIDIAVSSSGFIDDPYEPDDTQLLARPIPTDGTPQLHHSGASSNAYDHDWISFVSRPGHLYLIETERTGHAIADFGATTPELARTNLRLHAAGVLLAQNESLDPFGADPRSRVTFFENQASRTLRARVTMRDPEAVGPGYYYEVAVTEIPPPLPLPHIDAALPSEGSYLGGYVLVLQGSGFVPGLHVGFDGVAGTVVDVEDCDARYSCSTIKVVAPPHVPVTVDVTVTNPDGRVATLSAGFSYLATLPGSYQDGWPDSFGSLASPFLGYGKAVCFGDYDNDGWVDVFRGANPPAGYSGNILLHNRKGRFTDVTAAALGQAPGSIASCAWGDYDGDGYLDLVVLRSTGPPKLYHNEQDGTFADRASEAMLDSGGGRDATWFDYDHDGCLDLFLAYSLPDGKNELWQNRCNGTFHNAAPGLGLDVARSTTRVLVHDFNGDGWDDVYLANWSGTADTLYYNQHGVSFVDGTGASGLAETRQCADVKAADLNGDRFPDIICSGDTRGIDDSYKPPLWINDGAGHFTDRAQAAGLWSFERYCTAVTVFDRDNDGIPDVYFGCEHFTPAPWPNEDLDVLLSNDGASVPVFTDVTLAAGIAEYAHPRTATATAAADVGSDGDTDLYVTGFTGASVPDDSDYFWRNTTNAPWRNSPPRDWIRIRLRGAMRPHGTARLSPTWGEGAKVTVVHDYKKPGGASPSEGECLTEPLPAGVRAVTQEVVGGSHGQNPMELLFGLGAAKPASRRNVDCVIVDWPSGLRRAYTELAANSYAELGESLPSLDLLSATPSSGPVAGNNILHLAGFNFAAGARVFLGDVPASNVSVVSENLVTCTAPPHAPGLVGVSILNPDGAEDTIVDGYAYVLPVGSISVVDPNPTLMAGADISSDAAVLGSSAVREVFALAADGVTPVVLRFPVPSAGVVDFSIHDEARRTQSVGGLRSPGTTTTYPRLTVNTIRVGAQDMGVAILQAPDSFWREAGDEQATMRAMTIEAVFHPWSGGSAQTTSTLFIVRPPILLLHGIWSDDATWAWALMNDPRFVVYAHDYGRTSDRYFDGNRSVPRRGVQRALERFRDKGAAGTKVAVFGHSMGGVLSRIHAAGHRTDYVRDDNFGAGDFYFLATLDAPHTGTPIADLGMALRDYAPIGPALEFDMNAIGMNIRNGAVWDLQTTSHETTHLPAVSLPVHALVATGGSDLLAASLDYAPRDVRLMVSTLVGYGLNLNAALPAGSEHDLVVGRSSQEGRLGTGSPQTTVFHYVDADNRAVHFSSVTRESNPGERAVELMNTPITSTSVWAPGFPGAPGQSASREDAVNRPKVQRAATGTIRVTAPAAESPFRQGDPVEVRVQPEGGFVPVRMLFTVTNSDAKVLSAAPWTAQLQVSQEVVGRSTIRVVAFDANETMVRVEVPIRVATTGAELLGLKVDPGEVFLLAADLTDQLRVVGQFSDGVTRDITAAAAGTRYDSMDRSIVTVSEDGLVTGLGIGRTRIVVRNGTGQAAVDVKVVDLPMVLTFGGRTSLSWPGKPATIGYDVVSGSLGQLRSSNGDFATAVTGCAARNIPATTVSVTGSPAIGDGLFYLLRYRYSGGPGSYDESQDWLDTKQPRKRDPGISQSGARCP